MKLFLFKKSIFYRRFINSAQIPCDKLYFSTSFPFILFFPFIMENPHRLLGPSAAHNVLIYVRQIPIKTSHFSFTVHYSGKFLFKKEISIHEFSKEDGVSPPLLLSRTSFTSIQNYHIQFLSH